MNTLWLVTISPSQETLAAGGWLVPLGPWFAFSLHRFDRLVPETATAKSYGLTMAPAVVTSSLVRSLSQLAATQGFLWLALAILIVVVFVWRRRDSGSGGAAAVPPSSPQMFSAASVALVGCAAPLRTNNAQGRSSDLSQDVPVRPAMSLLDGVDKHLVGVVVVVPIRPRRVKEEEAPVITDKPIQELSEERGNRGLKEEDRIGRIASTSETLR